MIKMEYKHYDDYKLCVAGNDYPITVDFHEQSSEHGFTYYRFSGTINGICYVATFPVSNTFYSEHCATICQAYPFGMIKEMFNEMFAQQVCELQ